ncbi:esterase-like activity of phytase family protein [Streptomyces sp. NPDC002309]
MLQRAVKTDPAGAVRLGRYDVDAGTWSFFGYRLDSSTPDDWIGLSEIPVVGDKIAVIERNNNDPSAKIQRICTVDLPSRPRSRVRCEYWPRSSPTRSCPSCGRGTAGRRRSWTG